MIEKDRFVQYTVKTEVSWVELKLNDRQANDLYNEIYRLARDVPNARPDHPQLFGIFDTLSLAGVDGTR